jgi:hypothetical protein
MSKNEKTGPKAASEASKLLKSKKTPSNVKTVSASDLAQAPDKPKKKRK